MPLTIASNIKSQKMFKMCMLKIIILLSEIQVDLNKWR